MHGEDSFLPGVSDKGDFLMPGERKSAWASSGAAFPTPSRCRVYYCDPQRSGQKGSCEKNHVEPGRILPEGSSFEALTAFGVATVCAHADNYPRKSLDGKTPYALAAKLIPRRLLDEPGISSARESATTREGVSTDKSKASANVAFSSAALRSGL